MEYILSLKLEMEIFCNYIKVKGVNAENKQVFKISILVFKYLKIFVSFVAVQIRFLDFNKN